MNWKILCLLAPAAVAATFFLASVDGPAADAKPIPAGRAWCGNPNKDWVCRWRGRAYAAAALEQGQLLPRRRPRRVDPGTRIATAPDGLARITFRDEANCTVGGGSEEGSEVVARWEPDVMLRQISGDFACSSAASKAPVESFCNQDGNDCAMRLQARGTFLTQLGAPSGATASLTERLHRHAQLVVCSGFVRVTVDGETGGGEAFGASSGRSRFVITLTERAERTEDETVTPTGSSSISSNSSSIEIDVVGTVPGRGRCASSFVQTQERFVEE
jgi:hypothetical protein